MPLHQLVRECGARKTMKMYLPLLARTSGVSVLHYAGHLIQRIFIGVDTLYLSCNDQIKLIHKHVSSISASTSLIQHQQCMPREKQWDRSMNNKPTVLKAYSPTRNSRYVPPHWVLNFSSSLSAGVIPVSAISYNTQRKCARCERCQKSTSLGTTDSIRSNCLEPNLPQVTLAHGGACGDGW